MLTILFETTILYLSNKYAKYGKYGDGMEILISNSSDKPIYEQICIQIKSMIMDGTLSAGQEEQLRIAEELLQKVAEIGRSHGIAYQQMANILKLFYEE